ncbi:hypothetical protein [Halorubellus salinus]|uniref:hypothetical protein n=1 Tax=Halorubellus salinus TaxID=755309 RepID=UPI001D0898ED|nr:hypothetical protein [Halorubellus salinus]
MRHVPDPNADDVKTLMPIAAVLLLVAAVGGFLLVGSGGPVAVTATAEPRDAPLNPPAETYEVSEFEAGHPVREAAVAAHDRNASVTVNGTITDRSRVNVGSGVDSSTLYVRVDGDIVTVEVRKRG